MSKPCIAIDVSKESSHYLGFYDFNQKVFTKPKIVDHSLVGFNKIYDLYQLLIKETNQIPLIVLEYTGVYHKTITAFFDIHNMYYSLIHPLKSSKHRRNKDNCVKTDKLDCINLAEMFYENNLGIFYKRENFYRNLKDMSSEYATNKIHIQKLEVTLNEKLAIIYPCFHKVFSTFLAINTLAFLSKFSHPSILLNNNIDNAINWYKEKYHHSYEYSKNLINRIFEYANSIVPGCTASSNHVKALLHTIELLQVIMPIQNNLEKQIISLAEEDSNYHIIKSIPGIGKNTAARIIAEIGSISRFRKPEQINSYAGIDPIINQSGKYDGFHLATSKNGNKQLRTILFLAVRSMIKKASRNTPIKSYYYKKKAQPRISPKVALIASVNKLIRLIFSLCKNGQLYDHALL